MPHFEVAVGTTLRSRDGSPISDTCSDFYAEEIRNKAQKRVDEINRKIETEELCGGNRGIAAFSVNTALSTHENTVIMIYVRGCMWTEWIYAYIIDIKVPY